MSKTTGLLSALLASLLVTCGYQLNLLLEDKKEPTIITKTIVKDNSKELVTKYLTTYSHLSDTIAKEIHTSVFKYSKEFNINPILLTAVIAKESSFQHWIRHSRVTVRVPLDANETKTETITTNAVGLTGVIWEIHKFRLLEHNITKKSDLYSIDMSIKAMCVVLDYYRGLKQLDKHTSTESAVLRYYGITYNNGSISIDYINKVNNKIGSILKEEIYR